MKAKIILRLLTVVFVFIITDAQAFDAVSLEGMTLNDKTSTIVGSCGGMTVYLKKYNEIVKGEVYNKLVPTKSGQKVVKEVMDGYVTTSDQTALVLKIGEKIETLSVGNGALSDYLGVNCMVNAKGRRFLLLRTNCSGSACGEEFHHVLFDAKNLNIVNPLEKRGDARCDNKCFKKVAAGLSIK